MKLHYKTNLKDMFQKIDSLEFYKNIIAFLYNMIILYNLFNNLIPSSCFMLIALLRIFRTMLNNDENEHLVCLLLPLVLMEILFSFSL